MLPYYVMLLVVVGLAAVSPLWERQKARFSGHKQWSGRESERLTFLEIIAVCVLVVFSAVRFGIGTDFSAYAGLYGAVNTGDWGGTIASTPQELGYTLLTLVTKTLSDDPQAIFWSTSVLTVVLCTAALKLQQGSFTIAVFFYVALAYYVGPFNSVRQGIAVGLTLWAAVMFSRNRAAFVVLIALAMSFHVSAVAFAVVFLLTRRVSPSVGLLAGGLLIGALVALVIPRIPQLGTIANSINDRYAAYLEPAPTGVGTYLMVLFKVFLVVYVLLLTRGLEVNRHYQVLAIVSVAILVAGTSFKYLARLEPFFGIFIVLALSEALTVTKDRTTHLVVLGSASLIYFGLYLANYDGLLPYTTVLG